MTRPHSLQGRLLALVLATVGAIWLAAALAVWFDAKHELDELLDSHLAQAAALLVAQQSGQLKDDEDEMRLDAPMLHRYAPKVAFQVWHEGRLVLRSTNTSAAPMAEHRSGFATRVIDGVTWRVFAARGAENDIRVLVGEQTGSRDDILRSVLRGMVGPMLVALPLLGVLLWWSVRRGLLPLRRIGHAIARREAHALQPIAPEHEDGELPVELAPLVGALDALFARIAGLIETERRFTADAAHELRTPIAAIRAQAQVAQAAGGDATTRDAALRSTLVACDHAAHLVEQLLTLARLEAGGEAAVDTLDLVRVTRDVLVELAPAALARRQSLELDGATSCVMRGNPLLLAVLVRNLADNALRYSPDGAHVRIDIAAEAGAALLRVQDSGPGLDEAQQQRLGERFFRVLGNTAPGSGLGWSIVRRIAVAHGATVTTLRSAALGGLAVEVRFPV
jgi:two-component system, OmpR family, sensor histidine kinase QseC